MSWNALSLAMTLKGPRHVKIFKWIIPLSLIIYFYN